MKSLFDVLKKNLGKDYKDIDEMIADGANLDGKIIIQTVYQYMLYQEQINRLDPEMIKIAINTLMTQKEPLTRPRPSPRIIVQSEQKETENTNEDFAAEVQAYIEAESISNKENKKDV